MYICVGGTPRRGGGRRSRKGPSWRRGVKLHVYMYIYTHMYSYIYIYMYEYMCVCVCVYSYVYIYIYIYRDISSLRTSIQTSLTEPSK